jgi:hypothetical protein
MTSLTAVHESWGYPSEDQIRRLMSEGVSADALTDPWPIGAARVRFDGNTFDVNPEGEQALIFRCEDHGETVDLIAWSPGSNQIGSWRAVGFCIGDLDGIWNPANYFGGSALRIHADPIAWLKANREGIVIADPRQCYAMLRFARRLSFADVELAKRFAEWVRPPKPTTEIFIENDCSERNIA